MSYCTVLLLQHALGAAALICFGRDLDQSMCLFQLPMHPAVLFDNLATNQANKGVWVTVCGCVVGVVCQDMVH
jgi:hypothetical protein